MSEAQEPVLLWWYFGRICLSSASKWRIKVKEELTASSRRKDRQSTEEKFLHYDQGESCTEVFCRRAYELKRRTAVGLQILRAPLPSHLLTGLTIFPFVSHVEYTSCLWVWVCLFTFWNFFGFSVIAVLTFPLQRKLLEDTTCHYRNREIMVFS